MHTEPAPRYSRPVPASTLPRVTSPQPRHRPLFRRMRGAIAELVQREREDFALRIGMGLGGLFALLFVAAASRL